MAIFGRKILVVNAEDKRKEELRTLKASIMERQNLESRLNTLLTEKSTTVRPFSPVAANQQQVMMKQLTD
jgi:hypothetical protein